MMVDGLENSVYEVDSEAVPLGSANPHGNAWVARRTLLARESGAQRLIDPLAGRYWIVTNPAVTNALGQAVGYKLVPGENVGALAHPDSSIARRAGFITRHLWVTRAQLLLQCRHRRLDQRPTRGVAALDQCFTQAFADFGELPALRPQQCCADLLGFPEWSQCLGRPMAGEQHISLSQEGLC